MSAEEEIFDIESVLKWRLYWDEKNGNFETRFKIKWKGYGPEEDSWEPESSFDDLEETLRTLSHPKAAHKSPDLNWLKKEAEKTNNALKKGLIPRPSEKGVVATPNAPMHAKPAPSTSSKPTDAPKRPKGRPSKSSESAQNSERGDGSSESAPKKRGRHPKGSQRGKGRGRGGGPGSRGGTARTQREESIGSNASNSAPRRRSTLNSQAPLLNPRDLGSNMPSSVKGLVQPKSPKRNEAGELVSESSSEEDEGEDAKMHDASGKKGTRGSKSKPANPASMVTFADESSDEEPDRKPSISAQPSINHGQSQSTIWADDSDGDGPTLSTTPTSQAPSAATPAFTLAQERSSAEDPSGMSVDEGQDGDSEDNDVEEGRVTRGSSRTGGSRRPFSAKVATTGAPVAFADDSSGEETSAKPESTARGLSDPVKAAEQTNGQESSALSELESDVPLSNIIDDTSSTKRKRAPKIAEDPSTAEEDARRAKRGKGQEREREKEPPDKERRKVKTQSKKDRDNHSKESKDTSFKPSPSIPSSSASLLGSKLGSYRIPKHKDSLSNPTPTNTEANLSQPPPSTTPSILAKQTPSNVTRLHIAKAGPVKPASAPRPPRLVVDHLEPTRKGAATMDVDELPPYSSLSAPILSHPLDGPPSASPTSASPVTPNSAPPTTSNHPFNKGILRPMSSSDPRGWASFNIVSLESTLKTAQWFGDRPLNVLDTYPNRIRAVWKLNEDAHFKEDALKGKVGWIWAPGKDKKLGYQLKDDSTTGDALSKVTVKPAEIAADYAAIQLLLAQGGARQALAPMWKEKVDHIFVHVDHEADLFNLDGPLAKELELFRTNTEKERFFWIFGKTVRGGRKEQVFKEFWSVHAAVTASPNSILSDLSTTTNLLKSASESRKLPPYRRDVFVWAPAAFLIQGGPFYVPPKGNVFREEFKNDPNLPAIRTFHSLLLEQNVALVTPTPSEIPYDGWSFPHLRDTFPYRESCLRGLEGWVKDSPLAKTDAASLVTRSQFWRKQYCQLRRWIVIVSDEEKASAGFTPGVEVLTIGEAQRSLNL
ncbi:hypothetical protein T439DRAFT_320219 [Meredithblackwellia eburnea MCA 4105]